MQGPSSQSLIDLDLFDDSLLLIEETGNIIAGNSAAQNLLGYSAEDFSHLSLFEISLTMTKDLFPFLDSLGRESSLLSESITFRTKDGEFISCRCEGTRLKSQKAPKFILLRIRRPEESKSNFQYLMDSGIFGITVTDLQGYIREANDKFLEILGFSRQELEQGLLKWDELTPREYRTLDEWAIRQLRETGVVRSMEKAYYHKQGHLVPVLIGAMVLQKDPGVCVSFILDISERKRMEEEQKKIQEELKLRESQLEEAQQIAHIGSWEWDIPKNKITWTKELYSIYGQDPLSFDTSYESYLRFQHPQDRERAANVVQKSLETKEDFCFQHRIIRANGDIRTLEGRGRVLCDQYQRPIKMVGTSQDITELVAAQEALKKAHGDLELRVQERTNELARLNEELADRDLKKDHFLAMLSHELRNPLSSLVHAIEILKLEDKGSPLHQKSLEILEYQSKNLIHLINDLLDISRISSGKVRLQKEVVLLDDILARSLATIEANAEGRKRMITFHPPFHSVGSSQKVRKIYGDPTRLEQIFTNLLMNAVKYTSSFGKIDISREEAKGEIIVSIKDNGIGMNKDNLKEIFELFYQTDQSLDRSQGGLGIGLTMVKRLLGLHDGSIEARSDGIGKGSEFIVRLPLMEQRGEILKNKEELLTGSSQEKRLEEKRQDEGQREVKEKLISAPKRILIVEDNMDSAELYNIFFQRWGYQTCLTHSGFEALDALEDFAPEVVLLDIGLPGLNGYEVAKKIRSHEVFKNIILIALTGYGQEEDRKKSQEAGFNYHLLKPTPPKELKDLMNSLSGPGQEGERDL